MVKMLWGKKIGMSQVFSSNAGTVIPVTFVNIGKWHVLQKKTKEHDGYDAIQIGFLRLKYSQKEFNNEWLKKKNKYFSLIKEIYSDNVVNFELGASFIFENTFISGEKVSVTGSSIGRGFQGGVKRYGFKGGRGSHGDKLGRKPGSLSGLRTQGRVFKGKRMPGHMGVETKTIKNITIMEFNSQEGIVILKGSLPGRAGSLIGLKKQVIS